MLAAFVAGIDFLSEARSSAFFAFLALLSLGFLVCVAFLWPFIDAAIRRKWKKSEVSIIVGILAALMIIGFTLWEALAAH